VGDGAVGKTSLIFRLESDTFPVTYFNTDNATKNHTVSLFFSFILSFFLSFLSFFLSFHSFFFGPFSGVHLQHLVSTSKRTTQSLSGTRPYASSVLCSWLLHSLVMLAPRSHFLFSRLQGQEDYDRLRPLSYPQTEVFLLCFRVDKSASFDSATDKCTGFSSLPSVLFIFFFFFLSLRVFSGPFFPLSFFPSSLFSFCLISDYRLVPVLREIRMHCPHTPIVFVGCQLDKRQSESKTSLVPVDRAAKATQQIDAFSFVECSASTGEGCIRVLEEAIRAANYYKTMTQNSTTSSSSSSSGCCLIL
jgi:GTPase SAR1 family protein